MATHLVYGTASVLFLVLGSGCATIGPPPVYPEPLSVEFDVPQAPSASTNATPTAGSTGQQAGDNSAITPSGVTATLNMSPTRGREYCARLAHDASRVSIGESASAWVLTILGTGAFSAGTIINVHNATRTEKPNAAEGIVGTSLTLGSAGLIAGALALFSRSGAADTLAQSAAGALTEQKDRQAYDKCVQARAAWDGARTDASKIGMDIANQQTKARQETEKKAEDVTKEAKDATKEAKDATKKAEDATKKAEDATKKAKDATKQRLEQIKAALKKKGPIDPELKGLLEETPTP